MTFVCLTKYNDVGMNHLALIGTSDESVAKGSRTEQRKDEKNEKTQLVHLMLLVLVVLELTGNSR